VFKNWKIHRNAQKCVKYQSDFFGALEKKIFVSRQKFEKTPNFMVFGRKNSIFRIKKKNRSVTFDSTPLTSILSPRS
jgi:hypothetical protein